MIQRAITGLCKIELPTATIRLCDGGRIDWAGEIYRLRDADFGLIGSVSGFAEGLRDELAPLEITLLPPSSAAAADLVQPAFQGSRVRFWLADYVVETGAVSGTPDLRFDGLIDQATLTTQLELELSVISQPGRMFELNIGNSLSSAFHKSIWGSGETGHDNATGLSRQVAWGVQAPPAPMTTSAPALPVWNDYAAF